MHLAIDWPSPSTPAPQLCLLLQADGMTSAALRPLAETLRAAFDQAAVAAPLAPHPGEGGGAFWFDPAAAEPGDAAWDVGVQALYDWVCDMQQRSAASPQATLIAGTGRGADLALALALAHDGLAGRVLSFGGRWRCLPTSAPQATTLHLLQADRDPRVDPAQTRQMLQLLGTLQADATLDLAEALDDALHPALIDAALNRLRSHVPLRTWRAALGAAANDPGS